MRSACRSRFNPLFFPFEYSACTDTANRYYAGVKIYGENYGPLGAGLIQENARSQAIKLRNDLNATDNCVTTVGEIGIYHADLINEIYNNFASLTGRDPTIFEFAEVSADFDYLNHGAWSTGRLNTFAASRQGISPPMTANSYNTNDSSITFYSINVSTNVNYKWWFNGVSIPSNMLKLQLPTPLYDTYASYAGFLLAIDNSNPTNKNIVEVTAKIRIYGSCSAYKGQPCR
jgi:hypothetical protein